MEPDYFRDHYKFHNYKGAFLQKNTLDYSAPNIKYKTTNYCEEALCDNNSPESKRIIPKSIYLTIKERKNRNFFQL